MALFVSGLAPAEVSIRAQPGFGGIYRLGEPLPVRIELVNSGVAVRGVLEFYFFDPLLAQEVPVALLVLQAVTGFVFLFLLQFAIFRARRYRLTRTRWRGIVAGQSGSAAKYALLAIVLIGLTGVTFGLAYPLMSTTLERYRMGNTWLGTERFAFSGQARELVAR